MSLGGLAAVMNELGNHAQPRTWRPAFTRPRHPCKTINAVLSQHFCAARSNRNTVAMASNRDVRDMLGLPVGEVAPPTASKKSKKGGQTKRIQGVAREVAALYGERPPPVAVYEESKAYRAKRQSTGPAKKWYFW
ncbi:hypothetical protein B5807_03969 [Epicoccum nigrum]|uniref:Uncharacterized protein n=1 Tax=Epicoccum nigrum TaxID=105696 RepID=A0A1Y2M7F0_EPING|nr:hypothetical protein B5807_03969 [Epicoccum nigrum]